MSAADSRMVLRILLVEDYEHDRLAFQRAFRKARVAAEITECVRASEAREWLTGDPGRFDLVVIDYGLPGEHGLELCRQLIRDRVPLPVVILTGRGSERLAVQALKAGAEDYLIKDTGENYLELLPVVLPEVVRHYNERQARQRAEAALVESRRQLAEILLRITVPALVIDADHRVTHWNQALENLTGIRSTDVQGTNEHWRAFYAAPRPVMADLVADAAAPEEIARFYGAACHPSPLIPGAYEAEGYFPDMEGGGRWLLFAAAPLQDSAGRIVGAIETLQDVTERKRAEQALSESSSRLMQMVDAINVPAFVIDRNHVLSHWNKALETLSGKKAEEMVGTRRQWQAFYDAERPVMADLIVDGVAEKTVAGYYGGNRYRASALIEGAYEAEDFFPALGPAGEWLFFTAAPLRDREGRVTGAIETLQNVSGRKRAEDALRESREKYRRLSITDGLTGLYNSRHFHKQVKVEAERATRYGHPLSLLLLDVDNFKRYNDTYGHLAGDHVLAKLAEVIRACLRRPDSAYRYGGEEFVVLLPETERVEAAVVAERLRAQFAGLVLRPDGRDVRMTVSIGVSQLAPDEDVAAFIRRADNGTYRAKALGKNRVVCWEPEERSE